MTMSINAPDFVVNFDIKDVAVGLVGFGYVGQAIESFFSTECKSYVYDKFKDGLDTLEDTVSNASVIFVCVPTPMNKDGSCYTGIVESAILDIQQAAARLARDINEFILVVKSTVTPGFTDKMKEKTGMRIIFSPEFLTEAASIEDFEKVNRVILGGDIEDARVVYKFFERKMEPRGVTIAQCPTKTAEMTKLFTNAFLMTKVLFANEMYQVCSGLEIDYEEVMNLACLDYRIAYSHLIVPGPEGERGEGGHCFPKDINSLRHVAKEAGVDEKMFSAVIQRNDELRVRKDWLEMKGRAVVEEYEDDSDGSGRDDLYSGEFGDVPSSET